ncbi:MULTISPECIES: DUF4160 domain-containing protein [unclassified Wenzhouxiangella]|uniref:DUF4160 domain-containing protein n=1 Tax=unclassified Wenzhouxiangella TaxID=2613841 RepID=UPI000E3296E4|nr:MULTISPECIES: DUF4160 domain-containing protein [unclassified Wenzhouxiangella]RFF27879.1 DUF4160 domain-containing protein [Wenzhouxiangella sp. 15181]RFP68995.1 DUF4160 domain-containing protein [Wenzhouxiangella sp. 15190]
MRKLNIEFLTVSFSDERRSLVTVSMYYGVIVKMMRSVAKDSVPLITAYYKDNEAAFDFRKCCLIKGELPQKQTRLVIAWMELRKDELEANWRLITSGEEPFRISPLY